MTVRGQGAGTATRFAGAAFFDVDETLIRFKSMASFLDFYALRREGFPSWADFLATLEPGFDRAQGNAAYYRMWAGERRDDVLAAGEEWFELLAQSPDTWVPSTVQQLEAHQQEGRAVILVTGSFEGPVAPIARALGADAVLDSGLEVSDGCYTGMLRRPMIGPAKAIAARLQLAALGVDRDRTWAYGDHESDLPLLELARYPTLVEPAPALEAYARARGIEVIPRDDTPGAGLADPAPTTDLEIP